MCCGIAGPVHSRTWPTLPCRRLRAVTQGLICPLHPACRAAPPMPSLWCRIAWRSAPHCTVCALLLRCCGQGAVGSVTHRLGAVGNGNSASHCLTAWGRWAVQLLQSAASLPGGSGQCNSCNALPQCPGAVGSATPATHRLTAWGQWTAQLPQCTAALPGGSGQCNSCNALPHCPGAVGSGTPAMHCLTAWGQRTVQLLQCTVSLPRGSGRCNSCNARPHCLGAVAALLREEAANMATGLGANCVT